MKTCTVMQFATAFLAAMLAPGVVLADSESTTYLVPCDAANAAPGDSVWRYPTQALRNRTEGRVVLNVRVDAAGKPVEVQLASTSGSPVLDRAARRDVTRTALCALDGQNTITSGWALVEANYRLYRSVAGR